MGLVVETLLASSPGLRGSWTRMGLDYWVVDYLMVDEESKSTKHDLLNTLS